MSGDEKALARDRGHYQRAADDAVSAFDANKVEAGEVSYGLLLRTCGRADRRNRDFCADLQANVASAEDAMWKRIAGRSADPVLARCRGQLHRHMKLEATCARIVSESERNARVEAFADILETLDRDLDTAKSDTDRARRCSSVGSDVYHDESPDPKLPALRRRVGERCKAALLSAEEHCAGAVSLPLEANDARRAFSTTKKEVCARETYQRVVAALVADIDRKEDCADQRYSDEIDASRLDSATGERLARYRSRIASLCNPVASRSSSGHPPAMLGPQPAWTPSQSATPARRGDCDTFSTSGQRGTIYQTGCR